MAYTTIDDPSAYFQVKTYTGNSGVQFVTNDGNSDLQPDFVWIKNRTVGYSHQLYDSSRGTTKALFSDLSNAETTISNGLLTFNTDGFGVNSAAAVNENELVAWQWKANGGTTSTNTNGTVNSTVQANTTAGFSIVQWASDGIPDTIGHGLSQAPDWIFMKSTVSGLHWFGYSRELGAGKQHLLALNYIQDNTSVLNNTDPSSTVFYTNHSDVSSGGMIAYCFHSVQGYSKFGKYVGNGSSDGPFVYTGFKPAFVMIKNASASESWVIYDTARNPYNVADLKLSPDTADSENNNSAIGGAAYNNIDILSNGFKCRTNNAATNGSGNTIIYMAFAEHPFVTSTGIPTTAR